jgi:hypothetical protein
MQLNPRLAISRMRLISFRNQEYMSQCLATETDSKTSESNSILTRFISGRDFIFCNGYWGICFFQLNPGVQHIQTFPRLSRSEVTCSPLHTAILLEDFHCNIGCISLYVGACSDVRCVRHYFAPRKFVHCCTG